MAGKFHSVSISQYNNIIEEVVLYLWGVYSCVLEVCEGRIIGASESHCVIGRNIFNVKAILVHQLMNYAIDLSYIIKGI